MILVTDYYPFNVSETFLENEIPYLAENFELTIISSDEDSNIYRSVPKGVKVFRCGSKSGYSFFEKIKYTLSFFFSVDGLRELFEIIKSKEKIKSRFFSSLYDYFRSRSFFEKLKNKNILPKNEKCIIYTYWSNYKTHAFTLKKRKNWTIITRMHGYDLYNERMATGRQVFKSSMEKKLSAICFVSEAGREYYKKYFLKTDIPLKLFRLGTQKPFVPKIRNRPEAFVICSCSNVIPLKRVDLIVSTLKEITDFKIEWHHFGDGEDFERIILLSKTLPENVTAFFHGRVKNSEVLDFYSENEVDCFITTSSTEGGCPVSIQEAMSFGIPIIATAVGGIPEMLENTNNNLLKADPQIVEIVAAIKNIINYNEVLVNNIKDINYTKWNKTFNQEMNNKHFISFLKEL